MPQIALDLPTIAHVAESGSEVVRRRLQGAGYVLEDAPIEVPAEEGGGGGIVLGTRVVDQLDKAAPFDGFWNGLNNCGAACLAMVEWQARRRVVYPDQIMDWMMGEGHRGYSYVRNIEAYLDAHEIGGTRLQVQSLGEFQGVIRDQVRGNRLTTVLTYWDWTRDDGGHFWNAFGCDEPKFEIGLHNPWRAQTQHFSWREVYDNLSDGWLIRAHKGGAEAQGFRRFAESWTAKVSGDRLAVRSGPSTRHGILRRLRAGERISLVEYTDDGQAVGPNGDKRWHRAAGLGGWCSNAFLTGWVKA